MKEMRRFPEILVSKNRGAGYEGLAGLKLKSLLVWDLVKERSYHKGDTFSSFSLDPKPFQTRRERLLYAVSSWPADVSLEMHMTALPNLGNKAQGRIPITLFIRVIAGTREAAREKAIQYYISLMPLLIACMPEAEFLPVTDTKELRRRKSPFKATHAAAVIRNKEQICLASPFTPLSIGFGPMAKKKDHNSTITHVFPWVPSMDDWGGLMDAFMSQLDPVQVVVRVCPHADTKKAIDRLEKLIQSCETFMESSNNSQVTSKRQTGYIQKMAIRQLAGLRDCCLKTNVFVFAPKPVDSSVVNLLGRSITGSRIYENDEDLFQGGFVNKSVSVTRARKWSFFPDPEPYTIKETACAFRLPTPPMKDYPGIPLKRARTAPAILPFSSLDETDPNCIRLFINEHQGACQPVRVSAGDRMRHFFILGQTGTGKTTLMQNMVLQDMKAGRGLAVIDPHGEMVDFLLGRIPKEREKDVIVFDPLERERPLGFNLLEWETEDDRDFIIDELYTTMDHLYDMRQTGGPIFESYFRSTLRLLMDGKSIEGFVPTILEFVKCFVHDGFREWLKKNIKDTVTLDFVNELEMAGGDAHIRNVSPYVTSKFSRFINDTKLRLIMGQEKTSFDFDDIMNNSKILLVKLGKGRFGSNVSTLLTNQIVSRFKQVTMKRGEMRTTDRKDFYMYIDECHNLPAENFVELLSEARKYRMGLVLATQYATRLVNSLNKEKNLLSAILGNVGTTVLFRLGYEDVSLLRSAVSPTFSSLDLVGLPNYQGYCRMQLRGEPTPPMSFKTEMIDAPNNEKIARDIIEMSGLKYGMARADVEAQIRRRGEIWKQS